VTGVPETFVLDPRGRIVTIERNQLTPSWIAAAIDPLLTPAGQRG
jgi:hypothetical protein